MSVTESAKKGLSKDLQGLLDQAAQALQTNLLIEATPDGEQYRVSFPDLSLPGQVALSTPVLSEHEVVAFANGILLGAKAEQARTEAMLQQARQQAEKFLKKVLGAQPPEDAMLAQHASKASDPKSWN